MALHALRHYAVDGVAARTVKIGVLALVFPELRDLLGMTGQARVGDIVPERYLVGRMGVLVAVQTPFQVIMGFARVALAALGDVIFRCGTVAGVAVETGDRLVPGAGGSYVCRWGGMALDAIICR